MHKTLEFIENRIKWKASQSKLPNKSVFLFENLKDEIKKNYLTQFNQAETGKIILLFTDSNKNWTAIGTKMIFGYNGNKLNSVKLDSIHDVISKNLKEQHTYPEKVKLNDIKKRNESELLISDFEGNEALFITKKGKDFFALWSIILVIVRLNK